MLSHISWQQYLTAAGVLTFAYYLVVILLFYKRELVRLLSGKRTAASIMSMPPTSAGNLMGAIQETKEESAGSTGPEAPEEETLSSESLQFSGEKQTKDTYPGEAAVSDTFDELEQLSIRLQLLMEKSGRKANRTELTEKIRQELAAFSAKVDPENFKEAVNRFVRQQCKELCNVQIEPADLKVIWS